MPKQQERILAVVGSRVRDVTVDLDLPDLYRRNAKLKEVIRFRSNDPIIRAGTRIAPHTVGIDLPIFHMELAPPDVKRAGIRIGGETYYRLESGEIYQLLESPHEADTDDATLPPIELPCEGRAWGGGGLNMAVALRGMSSYPTTAITYVDSARPLHEKEWFQRFWTTIAEAGPVDIELFNADMNSLKRALEPLFQVPERPGNTRSEATGLLQPLIEWVQRELSQYLERAGERGYRAIARLISAFDPLASVDLFLMQQRIRFAMLRATNHPAPANLVFRRIRDSAITIDDRIIFRGYRTPLDRTWRTEALEMLRAQIKNPGLIVINTVHDSPLFMAALEWAREVQDRQKGEKNRNKWEMHDICPILIVLSSRNLQHFADLRDLEQQYASLANLYVLFNGAEFGDYMIAHEPEEAKAFIDNMRNGHPPCTGRLRQLFNEFSASVIPGFDKRFFITLGSLGSLGVTSQRVVYLGTYAVPEKPFYNTTGCGDAFAAGVALLVFHMHNHGWTELAPVGHVLPREQDWDIREFTLMMQLGTAAAYAKASSPIGIVTRRDVEALLDHAYLPTSPAIAFQDFGGTEVIERPTAATRIGLPGILTKILDA